MSVAVFIAVEDADADGDNETNDDTDAVVDGESTVEKVATPDALGELDMVKVIVVLVRAVSVTTFEAVEDTDAEGVNEANDVVDADVDGDIMPDKVAPGDALGEPEIVKVIVELVRAVCVATFDEVEDTETEGDNEAIKDVDVDVDGDIMLEEVAPAEALGEPEIEKVIVVLVRGVSVAVLKPVVDTDTDGVKEANDDIDADVEGDFMLDIDKPPDPLGEVEMVKVIDVLVRAVKEAVFDTVDDTDVDDVGEANDDIDADDDGDIMTDKV